MTNILPFLKSLLSVPGLSGYESPAARLIEAEWHPLVDELNLSRLGSVHGLKKGAGADPRPSIMLAAHMDAIGLMVSRIEDGFLRITSIGGVDPRILPGQAVVVHTAKEDLPGVIVMPPAKLSPARSGRWRGRTSRIFSWMWACFRQRWRVSSASGTWFLSERKQLKCPGRSCSGHSIDNRASVAAVTLCLQELGSKSHKWDVWAAATVQEEINYGGAATSAFQLRPDLAIAIDVTFAKGPGANSWETFELGKGPTFGHGPNIHPYLFKQFKELAERLEIPYGIELMPKSSGTDGMATQITAEGIPTFVLSIPIRYMHTPVEMVMLKDIQRAGRLLAEFIARLEPDFMSTITWDD